ncbi:hypothetical protein C8R47DRAFT_1200702, partial [Mycena vitilis]
MSTAKRTSGSRVSRKDRAFAREYLARGANPATIRRHLNISESTLKRIRANKYEDKVEEDARFLTKQEDNHDDVATRVPATTGQAEVIVLTDSESEPEIDELEEEGGRMQTRSKAGPSGCGKPDDVATRQPLPARSKAPDTLAPSVKSKGKRARFEDDSSKETQQKRQKRGILPEYMACSDCHRGHTKCDGPQKLSHICSKSKLECAPRVPRTENDESAVLGNMSPPSSLSSLGSTSAALGRDAMAGESSLQFNGAGKLTFSLSIFGADVVVGPSHGGRDGSVDIAQLHRLSLDPAPTTSSKSMTAPPRQAPSSSQGRQSGSLGSRSVDGPSNPVFRPAAENKNEDSLPGLLAKWGLSHCLGILQKHGFNSVEDLQMLKMNIGKVKTREEVRDDLRDAGMLLRDWLLLSD